MINREITYKRDINNSYMIVPAMAEENFDEKRLLNNTISNLLSVKKCYVATTGQYWYDITGKQALDAYCRINSVGRDFFEMLILKLCQIVERLEWNLVDVNCLVLDPELIFMNVHGEEVFFVAYPFHKGELTTELQQLLEYLLTKLNHKDATVVGWAYRLYEMAITEGMSISDLKRVILEEKSKDTVLSEEVSCQRESYDDMSAISAEKAEGAKGFWEGKTAVWKQLLFQKVEPYYDKIIQLTNKCFFKEKKEKEREDLPIVVYPEEEEEQVSLTSHPTVCIASVKKESSGLRCDRQGVFPDFVLDKGAYIIGKNARVQFQIEKDTISQFHARIEYQGEAYYIEDLNSTNGTYVNDLLLSYKSRRQLQRGDHIRFGDVEYHFY